MNTLEIIARHTGLELPTELNEKIMTDCATLQYKHTAGANLVDAIGEISAHTASILRRTPDLIRPSLRIFHHSTRVWADQEYFERPIYVPPPTPAEDFLSTADYMRHLLG